MYTINIKNSLYLYLLINFKICVCVELAILAKKKTNNILVSKTKYTKTQNSFDIYIYID